jgi:hypothetical protein
MKPIIFLDVDGVLNNYRTTERCTGTSFIGVDPKLCELFRQLVVKADASIVLSSTWRDHPKMLPYLWRMLGNEVEGRLIGATPKLPNEPRAREINFWLSVHHHDYEQFAILDDTNLGVNSRDGAPPWGYLVHHLVQVDPSTGLTQAACDKAAAILAPRSTEEK